MASTSLKELVDEWVLLDKNPITRNEIEHLWQDGNVAELERRMRPRIEFGTAGLRGKMEAGWSRINDLVIIQTSQGLCTYVQDNVSNAAIRGVIIGHDHRHNSEKWAKLTAATFLGNRFKVYLYDGNVHTPLVPFGVKKLNAACGVMITASHNPKEDNGYKVYWENAVQIIEPHDTGISDSIKANLHPQIWGEHDAHASDLYVDCTENIRQAYFASLSTLGRSRDLNTESRIKFVNTSMHGVSNSWVTKAFENFGFRPFISVKEQEDPDPDFPTVRLPNPEEKGALDLALRTAHNENATYVLAQDPDADRFLAAEKDPNGEWIIFTGDQLGIIFASRVLDIHKSMGKSPNKLAMIASTVSSKMIEAMAQVEGFKFVECLTGFKFIGNTALDLVEQGFEVPFGYEEAIGYMFGSEIRDKDGVAATVLFAELVASLHHQGKTVSSYLQELYQHYGYFETSNNYFICRSPAIIEKIFARIRSYGGTDNKNVPSYPAEIAGLSITSVVDLTTGYDSTNAPTYKPALPLSSGHMIQFRAEHPTNGTKIVLTIRTSGTEPKIKYYLEGSGKGAADVKKLLPKIVSELEDMWLEAGNNNLEGAST